VKNSKTSNALWAVMLVVIVGLVGAGLYALKQSGTAEEEAAAPTPVSTGRVTFLMEQQWLIKLKLAKAEPAMRAPQIQSTGRVVPVPSKRAIVAPPVGGIIRTGTMPRIGQRVVLGQQLATLIQTPTAAEAAQVQAAHTQIHIESTRLEAERRRLAQVEIEAEARLEEATHDLGRSQRLYEKKAYSAKALEADELARKAAAAPQSGPWRKARSPSTRWQSTARPSSIAASCR